jgi:hypothetical protein
MEDFLDAKAMLEGSRAAVEVSGSAELAVKVLWFLEHPEELTSYGERARAAALKNRGAAEKHAKVIEKLIAHR